MTVVRRSYTTWESDGTDGDDTVLSVVAEEMPPSLYASIATPGTGEQIECGGRLKGGE